MDHDAGVKVEQNPNWPRPGAVWLTVRTPSSQVLPTKSRLLILV